jgi:hypothetical protein
MSARPRPWGGRGLGTLTAGARVCVCVPVSLWVCASRGRVQRATNGERRNGKARSRRSRGSHGREVVHVPRDVALGKGPLQHRCEHEVDRWLARGLLERLAADGTVGVELQRFLQAAGQHVHAHARISKASTACMCMGGYAQCSAHAPGLADVVAAVDGDGLVQELAAERARKVRQRRRPRRRRRRRIVPQRHQRLVAKRMIAIRATRELAAMCSRWVCAPGRTTRRASLGVINMLGGLAMRGRRRQE